MKNRKSKTKMKTYLYVGATVYDAEPTANKPELVIGFAHTQVEARNKLEAYEVGRDSIPEEECDDIATWNDYVIKL